MTVMNNEDPAMPEELTRDEEMHLLRMEVFELSRKVTEYHRGNTTLLKTLMHLTVQPNEAGYRIVARSVLKEAGVMFDDDEPNWSALKARQDSPMTWRDAVCMFVKQPAERDRILALG